MKGSFVITVVVAALAIGGGAWWLNAAGAREPASQRALPAATPVLAASLEPAPGGAMNASEQRQHDMLALEIERALVSRDAAQRETAFAYLLPELLQAEPRRVAAMVAHQEPGEARDTLRTEVARLWITKDRDAAIAWMKTFEGAEQRASAEAAVDALSARSPAQAIYVADQFGVGRDNGYLEHLVQIWATENLGAAENWIATQPGGPKTDQLRARIDLVREQKKAARG